jgi:hypothetical protein
MGQVSSICEALNENSLNALDLSPYNDLNDSDLAEILCSLERNISVKTLVIANMHASMQLAVLPLCRVIRNHPLLTSVTLRASVIQPEILLAFSASKSIRHITLENCRLDSVSLRALSNMLLSSAELRNCPLERISLRRNNGFSDYALKKFMEVLSACKRRSPVDILFDEYAIFREIRNETEKAVKDVQFEFAKDGYVKVRKLATSDAVAVPKIVVKSYPAKAAGPGLEENKDLDTSPSSDEHEFTMMEGEDWGMAEREENWHEIKWRDEAVNEDDEFVIIDSEEPNAM